MQLEWAGTAVLLLISLPQHLENIVCIFLFLHNIWSICLCARLWIWVHEFIRFGQNTISKSLLSIHL